jgi:hypothetical protein
MTPSILRSASPMVSRSAVLLIVLGCVRVLGQDVYVDSALGSDNHSGVISAPIRTLQEASRRIGPGARVFLRADRAFVPTALGAGFFISSDDVTVTSYGSGPAPIVHGLGLAPCIALVNVSRVRLSSLDLRNLNGQHILVTLGNIDDLEIRGVRFVGGAAGVASPPLWSPFDWPTGQGNRIVGCKFEDQWYDGVTIHGAIRFSVSDCFFHGIGGDNSAVGAGDPLSAHDDATIHCEASTFVGNRRGAMVNINQSGLNRLVDCWIRNRDGESVVRQEGGGVTVVERCFILQEGSLPTATLVSSGGGVIAVRDCNVILNTSNSVSVGMVVGPGSMGIVSRCRFITQSGMHIVRSRSGAYFGDFNTFSAPGRRFIVGTRPDVFQVWRALNPGQDLNSRAQ